MKTIPKELETLISQREFKKYHNECDDKFNDHVRRFLTATMDEVRITTSNRAALEVLKRIGLGDFDLFRKAVLARELTGKIAYVNQRDHSSHTLYNYLLGWYFFVQRGKLREALAEEFNKRGTPAGAAAAFPFTDYSVGHGFDATGMLQLHFPRHQQGAYLHVGSGLRFPHFFNGLTSVQAKVIGQRADKVGAERPTRPFQGPASISRDPFQPMTLGVALRACWQRAGRLALGL